jgi:lysophospholipase L1-like esterase
MTLASSDLARVLGLLGIGRRRASARACPRAPRPGRSRARGPARIAWLLGLGLAAGLPGRGAAETPAPTGVWDVEEFPEVLSIHAQRGLTAVVRVQGVHVAGSAAPSQFAAGFVSPSGTGFLAPLINPGPFQDSGKRLSLLFPTANPTRLRGTIVDASTGAVERRFTATKVFPVSGLQVLGFGDSITLGVGGGASGGYPAILQDLLDAEGLGLGVANAGVGGETVFEGSRRLPVTLDATPITPGVVLIVEGINGLDDDAETIEHTLDALLDMVATVRARGGLPILGTLTPVKSPDTRGPAVSALNARIRQAAAERAIRVADHHKAFGGNTGLLDADGLHPNAQGYQVMAETWLTAILAAW